MEQTDLSGDGKVSGTNSNQTPIWITVQSKNSSGASLQIESGPLVVKGRSVGRSRTSTQQVDAGGSAGMRAPTNFFVCLPSSGIKTGQKWKAGFYGGAPLPAGMIADYTFRSISKDGKFAIVDLQLASKASGDLKGKGTLFLRTSDGFLDHGSVKFEIAFSRPDQKDRNKMVVNSRVVLKYAITPR